MNLKLSFTLITILISSVSYSQSIIQEKVKQLEFLTGNWVGISTSIKDGEVINETPAYQKISFDLDSSIVFIQLKSTSLQLHTIIQYDEKESTYFYHPFSKSGMRKLPATLEDGKLIVNANAKTRFIFSRLEDGRFREYGEKLIEGKWEMHFQDTFEDVQ